MHEINYLPPERMTPEQRRREVASLLANGLVRLRSTAFRSPQMACQRASLYLASPATRAFIQTPSTTKTRSPQ